MRLKFAAWTTAFSLRETSNFLEDMAFKQEGRRAHELQINILQRIDPARNTTLSVMRKRIESLVSGGIKDDTNRLRI